jgi:hypothetical protein
MGFTSAFFSLFRTNKPTSSGYPSQSGVPLQLMDYWQDRQDTYADEWSFEVKQNATELVKRVNMLLTDLNVSSVKVTSGWRPREINKKIGGAPRSYHITGQAVDLRDNKQQEFGALIIKNNHLLHRHQLWLENPKATKGNTNWIHLDIGTRPDGELRVFNP